ncbi:histidine kinase [Cytophagales bacterium WSM2-2]|nr:histidine kinase [Cytophagales bacterium WSM2-2]
MEIETAQRGYGLTGDELFLAPYTGAVSAIRTHLHELDSLVTDNQTQHDRIIKLHNVTDERIKFADEVVAMRKVSFEKARNLVMTLKGKKQMDSIKQLLSEIQEEENSLIIERTFIARKQFYLFVTTSGALVVSTLVILVILTYTINSYVKSRVQAEEKSRRSEMEAVRVNKELESFSYSVSHDLRAPLRSIDGYAQILKEDYAEKLDDEANRVIGVIVKNARHMGQLIDDLLDFSKLGKQEIRKANIIMDDIVNPIVADLMQHQKDRRIELDIQPLKNCPADVNMLRQVWINLLSNALKYSQKREIALISVGSIERADEVEYFVKDNGAGFDMQFQDKLFGVFQRLHKPTEFEGTGVGLALVKRIVERHNGRIWAEAKVNEGAAFFFTIPK